MPTPATVEISESNGAGAVVTDGITNMNFGGADVPNLVVAEHPTVRTSAVVDATFASMWKCERIHLVSLGTSALIEKLRVWKASGALPLGADYIRSSQNAQAFVQPAHTNLAVTVTVAQMPTADPAAGTIGIGGSFAGQWIAAPDYSNYVIFQTRGNQGAVTPTGAVPQKVTIFAYDES